MCNVTTLNHFYWWLDFVHNISCFNKPNKHIAHIKLYTQRKRLLLAIIHCPLYNISISSSLGGLQSK